MGWRHCWAAKGATVAGERGRGREREGPTAKKKKSNKDPANKLDGWMDVRTDGEGRIFPAHSAIRPDEVTTR